MEDIERVEQVTPTQTRWHANILGMDQAWNANITEQIPDQRVAWRSEHGATHNGVVTFRPIDNTTTEVTLQIEYEPEGIIENVGSALGVVDNRIASDLKNFKQFIEARGEATGAWRGEVKQGALQE